MDFYFSHSLNKWKDSLETWAMLLIFLLELRISGVVVQEHTSKQQKMTNSVRNCSMKVTLRVFSHFLLLWPWCKGFPGSSEDLYRWKRVSQMLLVCYDLLNSQNIPINQYEWKMVVYKDTSNIARKTAEIVQKKSNNWPMVSFIYNGSEVTTWMGHSFKRKTQNPEHHF